ncbi:MAG TPA: hypothetical protein VFW71_04940 [Actinomycetota bacterium]|nr:hypothetical protein [Actinomycetota bacterium]
MKRAMSGKTRRGSPPLPRQRKALRVVQLTFLGLAGALALLTAGAWRSHQHPLGAASTLGTQSGSGLGEVVALGLGVVAFAGLAAGMGLRVVRGPEPRDPNQLTLEPGPVRPR